MKINSVNLDLNDYNNNSTVINETLLTDYQNNFISSLGTNKNIDRLFLTLVGGLILVLLNYQLFEHKYQS